MTRSTPNFRATIMLPNSHGRSVRLQCTGLLMKSPSQHGSAGREVCRVLKLASRPLQLI